MKFETTLQTALASALGALGCHGGQADAATTALLAEAARETEHAAAPRYTAARYALEAGGTLSGTGVTLAGEDIKKHLNGCKAAFLLALTLGPGPDAAIRKAEATDMRHAVLLDAAASTLIEQYAEEAEHLLRQKTEAAGEYLTGRFSPGYGDLPITLQKDFARLLNTQRAIGLTVSESGILLPRKSITAVLGVADTPVTGHLAGCEHCKIHEKCTRRKEGDFCGKPRI